VILIKKIRYIEYVAFVKGIRNLFTVLIRKHKYERPLERPRQECDSDINVEGLGVKRYTGFTGTLL
jgi:hypothetical protein